MQIVLVKDCINAENVNSCSYCGGTSYGGTGWETAMGGCVNYLKFTGTTFSNEP